MDKKLAEAQAELENQKASFRDLGNRLDIDLTAKQKQLEDVNSVKEQLEKQLADQEARFAETYKEQSSVSAQPALHEDILLSSLCDADHCWPLMSGLLCPFCCFVILASEVSCCKELGQETVFFSKMAKTPKTVESIWQGGKIFVVRRYMQLACDAHN